jgi:hypothetical protein
MEEHEEKADELERDTDRLEEQSEEVQGHVDEVRSDFEGKLGDAQAPGLLEEEDAAPGGLGPSEDVDTDEQNDDE